jgi:hypothetical protein
MKDYNLRFISKIAILEGNLLFNYTFPDSIKTSSKNKKDEIIKIRTELKKFFKYNLPQTKELVDVAIIIYVNDIRMRNQDVDNIAKVILDSISRNKTDSDKDTYILENDSQIVIFSDCLFSTRILTI